jgi:hypothetical protein
MAYGTRIEEVEQASSSRKKVMKAFGYTVCALAVVACLLVATGSQVSTVDVLEEQSAEFSVLNAPAKPVGKAAAHTAASAHSSAHHSEVAHASAAHASAAHASAAHASAAHASAAHASAAHASAAHASAAHAPAAHAPAAGMWRCFFVLVHRCPVRACSDVVFNANQCIH